MPYEGSAETVVGDPSGGVAVLENALSMEAVPDVTDDIADDEPGIANAMPVGPIRRTVTTEHSGRGGYRPKKTDAQSAEEKTAQDGIARYSDGRPRFSRESAFRTWYITAHNQEFDGVTEGFPFHGGVCVVAGLREDTASEARIRNRLRHLHAIESYDGGEPIIDERTGRDTGRIRHFWTYQVLTEEEYEAERGHYEAGDDLDEIAEL